MASPWLPEARWRRSEQSLNSGPLLTTGKAASEQQWPFNHLGTSAIRRGADILSYREKFCLKWAMLAVSFDTGLAIRKFSSLLGLGIQWWEVQCHWDKIPHKHQANSHITGGHPPFILPSLEAVQKSIWDSWGQKDKCVWIWLWVHWEECPSNSGRCTSFCEIQKQYSKQGPESCSSLFSTIAPDDNVVLLIPASQINLIFTVILPSSEVFLHTWTFTVVFAAIYHHTRGISVWYDPVIEGCLTRMY